LFLQDHREINISTSDGKDVVFLSGYAVLSFKGTGDIIYDDLDISLGPNWEDLDKVIPNIALASISYDKNVYNALWSVNNCRWEKEDDKIMLKSTLAIRGIEAYINRLSYQVTAVGKLQQTRTN
jgi:hypothetical protein